MAAKCRRKVNKEGESDSLGLVRIPDDADQRSGMMPITIPF
jgi:hypothetical protein